MTPYIALLSDHSSGAWRTTVGSGDGTQVSHMQGEFSSSCALSPVLAAGVERRRGTGGLGGGVLTSHKLLGDILDPKFWTTFVTWFLETSFGQRD